ncbi:hypothetical protein [Pseudoalteromonas arctica]|nr:hypothetical protein [Pseudoalteromonas arctica]
MAFAPASLILANNYLPLNEALYFKEESMKPEDYNPKAKEAFGKSLIDIGVAIFKGIILLFTVVPLAAILQIAINGNKKSVSLFDMSNKQDTHPKFCIF